MRNTIDFTQSILDGFSAQINLMNEQVEAWMRGKDADECMEYIAEYLEHHDALDEGLADRLEADGITETPLAKKRSGEVGL